MRKSLFALALVAAAFSACSSNDQTSSTPTPVATIAPGQAGAPPAATSKVTGHILGPAGKAQDTVDQLNNLQNSYGGDE